MRRFRFAVLGSGGWGTAMAVHLAKLGHPVTLWAARPEWAAELAETRENARLLPGVRIPDTELVGRLGTLGALAAHLALTSKARRRSGAFSPKTRPAPASRSTGPRERLANSRTVLRSTKEVDPPTG